MLLTISCQHVNNDLNHTLTNNVPYTGMVETTAIGCYSAAKATATATGLPKHHFVTEFATGLPRHHSVTELATDLLKHYYSNHMHRHWLGPAALATCYHQMQAFPALLDQTMSSAADMMMWTD